MCDSKILLLKFVGMDSLDRPVYKDDMGTMWKDVDPIDVYGDTAEIIEDCLDDLQPFIDEVIPKEESESGTDFSEDNYIEQISGFFA